MMTRLPLLIFIISLSVFTQAQTKHIIKVENYRFVPNQISIFLGDTLRWEWVEGVHTTSSIALPTGGIPWSESLTATKPVYEYVPQATGSYGYFCMHHGTTENMTGQFSVWEFNGIRESELASQIIAYPNPFSGSFNIELPASLTATLDVFSIQGRLVWTGNLTEGQNVVVPAGPTEAGIYILKIRTSEGYTITRKICRMD